MDQIMAPATLSRSISERSSAVRMVSGSGKLVFLFSIATNSSDCR
jgi:hypothetical protein